jgi:hypothetical protein
VKLEKYKPNRRGIKELLVSAGVQADLTVRAERVAEAAQEAYDDRPPHEGRVEVTVESEGSVHGRVRARAAVVARHPAAQFIERDRRPLGSSLDAAGDL